MFLNWYDILVEILLTIKGQNLFVSRDIFCRYYFCSKIMIVQFYTTDYGRMQKTYQILWNNVEWLTMQNFLLPWPMKNSYHETHRNCGISSHSKLRQFKKAKHCHHKPHLLCTLYLYRKFNFGIIQSLFFFTILLAQTVLVDKAAVKDLICCLKKRVEDKHCLHEKGLDANIGLKSFLNFHNCPLSFQKNQYDWYFMEISEINKYCWKIL